MKKTNDETSEIQGYVNIKVVAKYVGFKVSTIRTWVKRDGMPAYEVGRSLRFILREVDEFMKKKRIGK